MINENEKNWKCLEEPELKEFFFQEHDVQEKEQGMCRVGFTVEFYIFPIDTLTLILCLLHL